MILFSYLARYIIMITINFCCDFSSSEGSNGLNDLLFSVLPLAAYMLMILFLKAY